MLEDKKPNILMVDDLPEKLMALELILQDLDANIIKALSGHEALRHLLDQEFAVILLDVNMPDMDGFETAGLIRQRKKTAHTPIIFITVDSDEMQATRGYSLGAVDYIMSPVVPEVLRTKVKVFVDLFRMAQQIKRQAEERIELERAQAARAAAEEATRRSTFLADASRTLANSLDPNEILPQFMNLLVPRLAELGVLALVDERGRPERCDLAWVGPQGRRVNKIIDHDKTLKPFLGEAIWSVLATGQARILPGANRKALVNTESLDELPEFESQSAALVPLSARGRILGALALVSGPSGRVFDAAEVAFAQDLATRAATMLENARLYADVQEADRRKNEFLSMLAHELRNPLAPVRNAMELLRQTGPHSKPVAWVQDVVERQTRQLVRLVDDLLDVSRINMGKIQLRMETVAVESVVACAVETSRPMIDERHHELTVRLPETPLMFRGDSTRLAQVLSNLLNNAAKYTPEGGRVELTVERDPTHAVFHVRDSGCGIPREMLNKIFELFTQMDQSLDRSHGGLGIGLTLVKNLVEMHGGTVEAFSEGENQGAEFVVRLPLGKEIVPVIGEANGHAVGTGTKLCRVLIVDDNIDGADSLACVVRMAGHAVAIAHDGPAALAEAERSEPDVVLMDIGLPGMSGYEVARRMRQLPGLKHVALIAVTGYGLDEDQRRSREAGFQHHLIKPVDHQRLFDLIQAGNGPDTRKRETHSL